MARKSGSPEAVAGYSRAANILGSSPKGLSEDNAVMRRLRERAKDRADADANTRQPKSPQVAVKNKPLGKGKGLAAANREMVTQRNRPVTSRASVSTPDEVVVTAKRPSSSKQAVASRGRGKK